jgi:hypothetical protein
MNSSWSSQLSTTTTTCWCRWSCASAPGDYQVRADAADDGIGWSWTPWVSVTNAPHALEPDWQAASAAGASNGVLTLWVDGVQQGSCANLDNNTRCIDYVEQSRVRYYKHTTDDASPTHPTTTTTAFLPEEMNENPLDTYSDAGHDNPLRLFET